MIFKYSLIVFMILLSGVAGCNTTSNYNWSFPGGIKTFESLEYKSMLNTGFNAWCKGHAVNHIELSVPVIYPDNPISVLKKFAPRGKDYWPGRIGDLRIDFPIETVTPEKWRYSIFDWTEHRLNKWRNSTAGKNHPDDESLLFPFVYSKELYENLPLNGTYQMKFILIKRGRDTGFERISNIYLQILVDASDSIKAVKIVSYDANVHALERMKQAGVYIF